MSLSSGAQAATSVELGTSAQFAVLAGAGVTNTGSTTIQTADASVRGDVGTSPTNTITGDASISWLAPATGSLHKADAVALQAQADNLVAYNSAAGAASSTALGAQLDGITLLAGVHTASSALNLAENGTVTLDAENDPAAVFIFQVGSSLTMEVGSTVALLNGADPCNIFWQVSEDATIKANADFTGTLLAENAIVAQSGADIDGRLLAQNASVTLDNNTFLLPSCGAVPGADGDVSDADGADADSGTDVDSDGTDTDSGTDVDSDGTDSDSGTDIDSDGTDTDSGTDEAADSDVANADVDAIGPDTSTRLPSTGGPTYGLWVIGLGAIACGAAVVMLSKSPKGDHRRI
ncbi:ice-binding family protein [Aeromicrobium panaciterrae]|uniref:ice-binding family protein n=1 Tax=Aeromicrobium panaciterrae TaxID=363861 RepID=UPI0031DE9E30